ncbi:MAG: hypothetical protein ABW142_09480 [Thermoleophilaceae bacterium]
MHRPLRTFIRIATLALIAAAAQAGVAEARVAVYSPSGVTLQSASFRVQGVRAVSVRAAVLRVGRSHRALSLRRVRSAVRRGRVNVRVHRARRAGRRLRLVLRLRASAATTPTPARDRRKGGPAPTPPSPTTDPVPSEPPPTDPVPSDPLPSGPSGDCPSSPTGFQAGAWPDACWRPFAPTSPFNRPIPDTPRLVSNSDAIVQRMVSLYRGPAKMTAGDADTEYDYTHPLYYATAGDPLFTLHCYETSWGVCPIEGHRIRIPDAARPAGGGDAHLAVIDYSTGWEYDLYKVRSKPAGGGTLEFRWGGRTRLDGDGLGTNATAAQFALSAGVIRPEEIAAGRIDHALFMVVKCTAGKVYPALGGGAQCADGTNAPAGGMRFQLAYSDAEIEALAVPRWKKTILQALRTYGAYIGDTGGGGFNFQFQSGSTYTSFGQADRLVEWAHTQPGVSLYNGKYVLDLAPGVDWSRLRVIDPCVTSGSC